MRLKFSQLIDLLLLLSIVITLAVVAVMACFLCFFSYLFYKRLFYNHLKTYSKHRFPHWYVSNPRFADRIADFPKRVGDSFYTTPNLSPN